MSRLDDIEREAKERRDDRVRQYRGKLDVDGTTLLYNQLFQAETAVDELVAMVKVQIKLNRQLADHVRNFSGLSDERTRERDQARADVKVLRGALHEAADCPALDDGWSAYETVHKVLADTDREEYR